MIAAAGDDAYNEPSLAAAERCDAGLRIGGPSAGAEEEVPVPRTQQAGLF
jgi:hypothetical protein